MGDYAVSTETTRARNRAAQARYMEAVGQYRREDDLILDMMEWLAHHGVWAARTHHHVKDVWTCRPGIPDIVGCCDGRFFAMEVKRPGQEPRDNQVDELQAVSTAGGAALVVRSVGEVSTFIAGLRAGTRQPKKGWKS